MTLSLSQDTYSQTIIAQGAQIKALQERVQELEAKLEVLQRSVDTSLFI
jgi:peptidoglycan hydrolase CwlO-like protein